MSQSESSIPRDFSQGNSFHPNHLAVVGISYRHAGISLRQRFALSKDARPQFYQIAHEAGIPFCMVLSTCNRTEIYTDVSHISEIIALWSEQKSLSPSDLQHIFILRGEQAVRHLFSVTSGVDSQIAGDMQISQQVKEALALAKANGVVSGLHEKLATQALQCSKHVRNRTSLSNGVSSVPSAVAHIVRRYVQPHHRIVILGLGKMGIVSCRNLLKSIDAHQITIINRTTSKADVFADTPGISVVPYEDKDEVLRKADIVISSVEIETWIDATMLNAAKKQLVIDLSVPFSIDPSVGLNSHIELIHLDLLGQFVQQNLEEREAAIADAQVIIGEQLQQTQQWWHRRAEMLEHLPSLHPYQRKTKYA